MSDRQTEEQIPVTPEMIEAGVMEYCAGKDWLEDNEDVVTRIFRAMITAKRAGQASQSQAPSSAQPRTREQR
jgi:hypothetical protein